MDIERSSARRRRKRLKRLLLLLVIAGPGTLIAVFVAYRHTGSGSGESFLRLPKDTAFVLNQIHQTATRNGVLDWQLDAATVRYSDTGEVAVLEDPSVVLYVGKENTDLRLTAKRGQLHTNTKDIRVSDHVTMTYSPYTFETDTLYYQHEARKIYAKTPVKVSGDLFYLRADAMVFDLGANQTSLTGHVKGTFGE